MAKVIINVVGAFLYLFIAINFWASPELADVPGAGAGDPIIWGLTALPVLFVFILLNCFWLIRALIVYCRTGKWTLRASDLAVPAIWAAVIVLDYSHHWRL